MSPCDTPLTLATPYMHSHYIFILRQVHRCPDRSKTPAMRPHVILRYVYLHLHRNKEKSHDFPSVRKAFIHLPKICVDSYTLLSLPVTY